MCECIIISCAVSLFFPGKNRDIFMAAICDMAMGRLADRRYIFESVHDLLKTDFMINKVASSYTQMIFIVYCFQLTAPNKEKIISVSHVPDCVLIIIIIYIDHELINALSAHFIHSNLNTIFYTH